MIGVAKASVDARLPLFLVIPLVKGYSFIREGFKKFEKGEDSPSGERRAMFIGTGDFGFPPVMAISANVFVIAPKYFGLINLPAAMAIIGSLVGMSLIVFPHGDKFRPGLPLLNGGAMLGFIIGIFALMFGVVR
jgi:presenilin-like A22 family membrane protease